MIQKERKPHVVIVGAGFGGLNALQALKDKPVDITIIDRNNYHIFLPLLYQVAAAELEPSDITYPIRGILRNIPNARFLLAEVEKIDFENKTIETSSRTLTYDYLVFAPGSVPHFFNVPGAKEFSFTLKTLEEAVALRNQIICCFEQGAQENDPKARERLLTFIIVGGGATGIEYAGALSELVRGSFVKDFPEIDVEQVRIILLEAADTLLGDFSERLREYARRKLNRKGVDVRLAARVTQVKEDGVVLATGDFIPSDAIVWTAGVKGIPQAGSWGLPTTSWGSALVTPALQAPDRPEVYVIGDLAHFECDGRPLPQVAPVAVQQGKTAAGNILRQMAANEPDPFHYRDKGSMVVIGRNSAVVAIGRFTFVGFIAWVLWLLVHLVFLIGFRNRWLVLFNWAWEYVSFERYIRMILPKISVSQNHKAKCPVCFGTHNK